MCGIAGIIVRSEETIHVAEKISKMGQALRHRGPDGEGILLVNKKEAKPYYHSIEPDAKTGTILNYVPIEKLPVLVPDIKLALLHRRLSIIDLTAAGHQPMCNPSQKTWITYNGEVYNYLELKSELENLGYRFISQSDTEVILAAYQAWGTECVLKFNGMWAFAIYDQERSMCFMSRDRLGVKPLYYIDAKEHFSFASEQKAFVKSGLIKATASDSALAAYLVYGALERESQNFFEGINELMPGHNLIYDLNTHTKKICRYYALKDSISLQNESLHDAELISKIGVDFKESVRLRMRSDVEVGTCLSGGIDSSALAVTMSELGAKNLHCFTSVFSQEKNNEDMYASMVAAKIGGIHHKVEPDHESFMNEADELIYSQDVPIWSTSTYAQHKVMQLANKAGIKVVLDGQGADELFAGYHHHLVAFWNQLAGHGHLIQLASELHSSVKTIASPLSFYLKEIAKSKIDVSKNRNSIFVKHSFLNKVKHQDRLHYYGTVNQQLLDDIDYSRLKIFLKCEDRASMWHSVESRTPFSDDVHLINTAFSFKGERKIKNGVLKYLLREAVKENLPSEIYHRYDKTGFETPMTSWIEALKYRMIEEIDACRFPFLNKDALSKIDFSNKNHSEFFFKLFVLARWKKVFVS